MANHIDTLPLLTELPCQSADGPYTFAFRPDPECYEDMVSFFREYGFVVVKNIFSKEECEATRSAMWDVLEEQNKGISRSNPKTWSNLKSKGQYGLSIRGPSFHPTFVKNRQNPILVQILAQLIGSPDVMDVIVSQDRFTVYRATVYDDPDIDGEAFSTGERNLHLDMNPWWYLEDAEEIKLGIDKLKYEDPQDFIKENNLLVESFGRHVQCVLNFEENWSEDGGTLIVPCFHRYLSQWVVDQASLRKNIPWVTLPPDEQQRLLQHAHRICMQPGSVLIWDQRVMHGTQRNHSSRCRMAQYLKAYPRSSTFPSINGSPHPRLVRRAEGIRRELEKSGDISRISELGWHLFGLDCITEYERACNDQTVS